MGTTCPRSCLISLQTRTRTLQVIPHLKDDLSNPLASYLFLDVEAGQLPKLRKNVTANIDKLLTLIRRQFGGSRVRDLS